MNKNVKVLKCPTLVNDLIIVLCTTEPLYFVHYWIWPHSRKIKVWTPLMAMMQPHMDVSYIKPCGSYLFFKVRSLEISKTLREATSKTPALVLECSMAEERAYPWGAVLLIVEDQLKAQLKPGFIWKHGPDEANGGKGKKGGTAR